MDYNKEFQKRFSELAREISASNSELAQILDIDRKTLGNYINTDRALPSAENLIKISENAKVNASKDVSVDWLLGLVPHDNPSNDEKIRITAEYTGLSDDVIEYLHGLAEHDYFKKFESEEPILHLDIINSILSDKYFDMSVSRVEEVCDIKKNLTQEWIDISMNNEKGFSIHRTMIIENGEKIAADLYEKVIEKIVEEA